MGALASLGDYYSSDISGDDSDYDSNYDSDYDLTKEMFYHHFEDYDPSGRIVGGEAVNITEFPSMVYMRINSKLIWGGCGGVIISSKWVLTAAHCSPWTDGRKEDLSEVLFYAGSSSTNKRVSVHEAVGYFVHEDYHKELNVSVNDIALFKVDPEFRLDGVIMDEAHLPEPGRFAPLPDEVGTVVGFGRLNEYGGLPKLLQKVDLVITDKEFCQKHYKRVASIINDDIICTTGVDRFKGFCDGDSGGPLYVNDEVVGIVSWSGKPCGHPKRPSIFTRISAFRDWIKEKTGF